ncbi:MAG: replicative DNA helicase [Acidimicrobiia bacterium]|nr:replicative DNA helicase [Acidimicrobiia bacterium]
MSRTEPAPARPPSGGRTPPQNLQAEESLLGAMLLSRDAIAAAAEVLQAEHFYKPAHAHVYDAILGLYGVGEPADVVTVAEELRRAGLLDAIGGPSALVTLQASAPAVSNAGRYAHIIEELALLRRMIGAASEIAELGYSVPEDVAKAVDQAESMMFSLGQHRAAGTTSTLRNLLEQTLDRLEELYDRGEMITGTPTGYLDLDEILSGLQPNALVVVGARPAMGKTAFALGMATHAALHAARPSLFFSLEMSQMEITQRILCAEARVDATRVRNGRLTEADWEKISHAVGRLAEAPIWVDDNPNLTIMEIRSKARKLKSQVGDLGVVVVDYIQLMTGRNSAENRQVEVAEISRGLKILAREIETPVVALAQLNRGLEQRADKRPMLSDLRESGCLPASARILRADNGEEVSIGELVLSQEQPLVWSLDEHQRLVPARLTRAFPSGIKATFRLRLASGRQVEATANHPFLTVEGWRRLDQLQLGGFLAVPRCTPEPLSTSDWSDDDLTLLAHMLGEGTMGPSKVKYVTGDPANKAVVEKTARNLFGIDVRSDDRRTYWQMWFPSPYRLTHNRFHPMRNWLEPMGLWGSRSWTKFIPEPVFGQSDAKVALFLHHLWATDGSITLTCNGRGKLVRTYYATSSARLARDVQRLLLRLDIRSTISSVQKPRSDEKGNYRTNYHVRIQGTRDQERFLTTAGCHGSRGECVPEALAILACIKEKPNVDLVPWPVSKKVKQALVESGVTQRELATGLGEGYCGGYLLGSEARPRRFSRDRLRRMGGIVGSSELVDIATSDVSWDEVVEIVQLGEQPTFDATIAGSHNFVADGVIVHNSLEQDADVVLFLYRDEVYNRDSPEQGVAEVIVAKHRSGPTGVARLAFLGQYTRFANMAKG